MIGVFRPDAAARASAGRPQDVWGESLEALTTPGLQPMPRTRTLSHSFTDLRSFRWFSGYFIHSSATLLTSKYTCYTCTRAAHSGFNKACWRRVSVFSFDEGLSYFKP